jgi:hypothetical protein
MATIPHRLLITNGTQQLLAANRPPHYTSETIVMAAPREPDLAEAASVSTSPVQYKPDIEDEREIMLTVAGSRTLARLADHILVVVRWEKTPWSTVGLALRTLGEIGGRVVGIALTRVDVSRLLFFEFPEAETYRLPYRKYYHPIAFSSGALAVRRFPEISSLRCQSPISDSSPRLIHCAGARFEL